MRKHSSGFSLVELMVAMVIGLIIILGAGQLFLTVFQTNRQVETLGEKQAAVNFAVETLLRDIRRADWSKTSPGTAGVTDSNLVLTVPNRGDCSSGNEVAKTYSLGERELPDEEKEYYLQVNADCTTGAQELVGGLAQGGFLVTAEGDYGVLITLILVPTDGEGSGDSLTFFAVNRTAAVGGPGGGPGNGN